MNKEDKREQLIQSIAAQMRHTPFTFEFKIVEKPKGLRIVHEVTREEMDMLMQLAKREVGS